MCYCTLLQYSCFRVSTLSDPEARSVTCTWSEMIYVRSECCLLTDRTWSIYIYLHNPGDDDESLMVRPIHDLIIDLIIDWAWIVLGANIVTPPSTHTSRKQILDYLCTSLHNNEFMSPVVYFCSQNFFLIQISNSIFLPSPEKSFQPLALTMAPVAALAVWIN